jgi:hypothetical protein
VTGEARRTLETIRECIEADRYALTEHFTKRMQKRALFWPDVEALFDDPAEVRSQGMDKCNRPKWAISGEAADGGEIEVICAIESSDDGPEFITIYWEE